MRSNVSCPVCDKVGIPNYRESDITCPCCGSDLRIYRFIDLMTKKSNYIRLGSTAVIITAAIFGIISITGKTRKIPVIEDSARANIQLKDSIRILKEQLAHSTLNRETKEYFIYKVKAGESFWSISRKFYGSGINAGELAIINNKKITDILQVGDALYIK